MAQVFVSYRRADGVYAVEWLADRLRSDEFGNDVETTFHDAGLQAGDDFPTALEKELETCELLIAVIGPSWRGLRADGQARVLHEDDWVVREIATALQRKIKVMPIILDGAEHPVASQLHPSIAKLSTLHAARLANAADMAKIASRVRGYLGKLEEKRARCEGLENEIHVPDLRSPWLIAGLASVAGLIWALLGALVTENLDTDGNARGLIIAVAVWIGLYVGACAVVGVAFAVRLIAVAKVKWRLLAITVGLIDVILGLGFISLANTDKLDDELGDLVWVWLAAGAAFLLPWTLMLYSPGMAMPSDPPENKKLKLADRVLFLGIVRDSERWAAIVLSIFSASNVAFLAIVFKMFDVNNSAVLLTIASVLSGILVGSGIWSIALLREYKAELRSEIDELPAQYRKNASPRMLDLGLTENAWGFRLILVLPVLTATLAAVVLQRL